MTIPDVRRIGRRVTANGVDDLYAFLAGAWSVRRVVVDGEARCVYRFAGSAVFRSSDEGALAYVEEGVLAGAGREDIATRRLTYRFATSHSATVYFADDRLFHAVDLRTGRDRVQHDCAPDAYIGIFVVDNTDLLVRWRARGPETSYVSTTRFSRREGRSGGAG